MLRPFERCPKARNVHQALSRSAEFCGFPLLRNRRIAGNDQKTEHFGYIGYHFVGLTLCKIFPLSITAQVIEWEYRN